jgi:lipopolysaccharide/colanic/teichoic acid biosynthesis glycosyltransferase
MALLLLLGLSPLLVVLALIVKGSTPNSSIFSRQWCVGQGGKLFQLYQFHTSAETKDPENKPCLTLIGQWLQQFNLDTLPQLFNVLRGEMSLVGVPPKRLSDVLLIAKN